AGLIAMKIGPSKDLRLGERRQPWATSSFRRCSPRFGEKQSQGSLSRQASPSSPQCHVDRCPVLPLNTFHGSRLVARPTAPALMMSVGPLEDLLNTQLGPIQASGHVPVFGKEPG